MTYRMCRLKTIADVVVSNVDKHSISGEPLVKLCNYVDVYKNTYINSTLQFMDSTASEEQVRRYGLRAGDIILTKDSESSLDIAVPALVTENVPSLVCGYHLAVVRAHSSKINPRFLLRAFQSRTTASYFTTSANGITRYGLTYYSLKNAPLPVPTLPEQKAIADFLDRETAEADALVAKYERLIELLEEKRVALITRAVTKGLNPGVPMKDSGIECIGQIPSHWETRRIKFVAALRYGLGQPPPEMAGGLPFIRATNIDQGLISEAGMVYVDPNCVPKTRNAFLRTGEILIVRSGALTGDSAIVPVQYDGAVAGFDIVITGRHIDARFLAASVLMPFVRSAQLDLLKTRAAQPHLNVEDVGSILITLPPPTEQERIVEYIIKHDQQLQSAQRVARRAIALAREHRSALITAAVTGQIDVARYRSVKHEPAEVSA